MTGELALLVESGFFQGFIFILAIVDFAWLANIWFRVKILQLTNIT